MKKQLLLFVLMLLPMIASADAVEINGIYYNLIEKAKMAEVTSNPNKYSGDIIIPSSFVYGGNTYNVTSIGEKAFQYCRSLTSISIEYGVTNIGNNAFEKCEGLTSITIPNSVTTIGHETFADCNKLPTVVIPNSVTDMGYAAFGGCSSLTSITFSNNMTTIPEDAFQWCRSLTSVTIPNSVTTIGIQAFYECTNLTSVSIPNSVTTIEGSAFYCCTSLKSIIIPSSTESIGWRSFGGCSQLESVTLGNGLRTIGGEAFANCSQLTDVYCYSEVVPYAEKDNVFSNSYVDYATLHVLKKLLNDYKNTEPWSGFKSIVKIDMPEYTLTYKIDGTVYKTYSFEEGESITPEAAPTKEGYTFSGWSNIPTTMPANDMTITGTFTVNKYKLTYKVDGSEYKSYDIEYGASITPEAAPTKDGYTFSGWSDIPTTMPANEMTITGSFSVNKYTLTYTVDGVAYKTYDIEYGATITPEAAPTKDGYTFSGWNNLPQTMPANDVTVSGTFTIDKYKLTYMVDGSEYKSYDIEYDATITPEATPTKDGYTFSGWSDIPTTMPAQDVTVTGTFTVNKYTLTYTVDGVAYKTYDIEYGTTITSEAAPTKEGYTFSGWDNLPQTMPANNVTVSGSFIINKYKLTYMVDGSEYKSYDIEYGASITPEAAPTKEGYSFSGWSDIPSTMPARDVTVTGSFSRGAYTLTYIVDGVTYKTVNYDYGATITPETAPTKEGYTFSGWNNLPQTMPANDVTVSGTFTINKYKLTYMVDGSEYKSFDIEYGATITPEATPTKEGYTFSGWSDIPSTMPARDVTVTGSFSNGAYILTYIVDGEVYKTVNYDYGATITPEAEPTKEGYKFSGWSYIPNKMPAEDVTVLGTFTQEAYIKDNVTYDIDGDNASVTHADNAKGEIKIEESVEINGKTCQVTAIADGAFQGCTGLTSVELPNTIATIGMNAFDGCSGLIIIKIGKGIKEIGSKAFANIGNSKVRTRAEDTTLKVYCEAEVLPSTAADAFENTTIDKATLYVADNLIDVYKLVMPWNGFGTIVGLSGTGIRSVSIDTQDARIYDMQGNRLDNVRKGVNIIRTKDGKARKVVVK